MKSYRGFNPNERRAALKWLNAEYAAGRRQRPVKCDVCGETEGRIEAHSENYSQPFGDHIGAVSLCRRCHQQIHRRNGPR